MGYQQVSLKKVDQPAVSGLKPFISFYTQSDVVSRLCGQSVRFAPVRPAANDELYDELELRYGGAFAQWVVDRLNRA
ncbi:MAG: hypothetical protein OXT65_04730 [Alphaproteobacteria bacterium]|nr:hypothetical protein [Alphaproteobacteria bacterium]